MDQRMNQIPTHFPEKNHQQTRNRKEPSQLSKGNLQKKTTAYNIFNGKRLTFF